MLFEKHQELCNSINFEDHDISVSVNRELAINSADKELSIEKYREQTQKMQEEISALNVSLEKMQDDMLGAMSTKREIEQKQRELDRALEKRELLESSYVLPPVEHRVIQEVEEQEYGFLGLQTRQVYHPVDVYDDSERREAKKQLETLRNEYDIQIARKEAALSGLGSTAYSSEELKAKTDKLERKIREKQAELEQERARHLALYDVEKGRNLAKFKDEMTEQIDEISRTLMHDFKKELGKQIKTSTDMLADIVTNKVEAELKRKQEDLASQTRLLQSSEQEKSAKVEQNTERLSRLNDLLRRLAEISVDINAQKTDVLERERL
jgi:hypothetical protein